MENNFINLIPAKAVLIISINCASIISVSADTSEQNQLTENGISGQSQRFWQQQNEQAATSPAEATPAPLRMQTGHAISSEQEQEFQNRMYRQAFNQILSQGLPTKAQAHCQRFLQYLEERVSEETKSCLPDLLVSKLPPFLINTYGFQPADTPDQAVKKMTQLGLGIIGTPLLLNRTEQNNLAAFAFACAGHKALIMKEEIPLAGQCDFYLSVSQLFIWSAHRYQDLWAKRLFLDKASGALCQAISTLEYVQDTEMNAELSKTLIKDFLNILGRHCALANQEAKRTV
ncbi:hypothetical protein [Candidatus Finniella inopinata]|uniref:Uncharacterized protein n=1 Tax=Candidatus Finniella inopinata TaxID=1696036 RepID=A0A4Q7DF85_9PROT|nr:hypothetical protein [Candidatus Finniella inopinata]RZI45411.1 hypothetical protein EQU50_07250 [Candidatus Finniella inopinata]